MDNGYLPPLPLSLSTLMCVFRIAAGKTLKSQLLQVLLEVQCHLHGFHPVLSCSSAELCTWSKRSGENKLWIFFSLLCRWTRSPLTWMVPTSTEAALVSNTGSGCSPRGNLDTQTCTSGCNGHGGHFYGEGGRKPLAMRGDDDDGHNDDKRCKKKLSHINQVITTMSNAHPKETFAAAPWSRESRGGLQV